MRSYMVKYTEDGIEHTRMYSGLNAAKKFMQEKNGRIFIADGKNTKSLDGTDIPDYGK